VTVSFRDADGTTRLEGELLATGGTTGDVLTQQADGTFTPAAGGGSQPVTTWGYDRILFSTLNDDGSSTSVFHAGADGRAIMRATPAPPDWDAAVTYAIGDVVLSGGSLYRASAANTDSEPPSGDWDSSNGNQDYLGSFEPTERRLVVFDRYNNDVARDDVCVCDTLTGEVTNLTAGYNSGAFNPGAFYPAWSPDGTKIAFVQSDDAGGTTQSVRVMDADGSNKIIVAQGDYYSSDSPPTWSPDGAELACSGGDGTVPVGIYVFAADGSGGGIVLPIATVGVTGPILQVVWGSKNRLAFTTVRAGGRSTYTVKPDGTDLQLLTATDGYFCGWSPDGSRVLVVYDSGATYIYDLDGTFTKFLPDDSHDYYEMSWGRASDTAPSSVNGQRAVHVNPASGTFAADLVTALQNAGLMETV
jgi:WD40 repeat protein